MSRKFLVVPVLVLASALSACGGGADGKNEKKQARLDEWAAQVCAADVTTRIDDARAALADVKTVIADEQPASLRSRLSADIGKFADADTGLAEVLARAAAPPVSGGAELRASVVEELRTAAKGWEALQVEVDGLAVDKQNRFADGLRTLAPEIEALQASSHVALEKLHRGETGKALAAVPGCEAVAEEPPVTATAIPSAGSTGAPKGTSSAKPSASTSSRPSASASASASESASESPSGSADVPTLSAKPSGSATTALIPD